ncbi:LLM class flavin-dependent oxidoreductase [Amycolatopsis sp. NPDC051903]|uniref:LLM class flavin-dependent oxidoreductase n=1 Tax=Amycolatopsis sp. NPDC051903 TaxID=3363936 RepID=UPI0037ACFFAB
MADIHLSVALPASPEAADHIATAERLGYRGAHIYDTPFEGGDVWQALHDAAKVTTRIRLGPAVLVPALRHPLVNAAQTVSLHHAAPGRVMTSFGTGFSSRAATGQPPIPWSEMDNYIRVYLALLAGESAEWEGAPIQLQLTSTQRATLPIDLPLLIAAIGPKGSGVAKRLSADGIISILQVTPQQREFAEAVVSGPGTVLDEGEELNSERVRQAAGPTWAGVLHFTYTVQGADAVREMPGGPAWLEVIEKYPPEERHLHINRGHLVDMNEADLAAWHAGGYVTLSSTLTGTADVVRQKVADLASAGATEVMFEPSGPDIGRELKAFVAAVRG